jgi:hypothetical protein
VPGEVWKWDVVGDINDSEIFEVVAETILALVRLLGFEAPDDEDLEDT